MVRRVPTQVHKQVARLAQTGYIQREPLWYRAVLEHPPLPLPARAPANRFPPEFERHAKPYDLPQTIEGASSHLKKPKKVRAEQIVYLEDQVRRQFFRDHPFEAFRERSLVEEDRIEDEHPINGAEWTRLSQRTRNPNSEDAVRFAVNLYENTPDLPLSEAYAAAVLQFRALRSEQKIAAQIARLEAEHFGTKFKPGPIQQGFDREEENLKSWTQKKYMESESNEARKRWKMVASTPQGDRPVQWTEGKTYTRLWKDGIRPDYSPALSDAAETQKIVDRPQLEFAFQH